MILYLSEKFCRLKSLLRMNELSTEKRSTVRTAFLLNVFLLSMYILFNYIISGISHEKTKIMNMRMLELMNAGALSPVFYSMHTFPGSVVWSFVFLFIYEVYFLISAYILMFVFGEKERSFLRLYSIFSISFAGFLLSLFPLLLYGILFPDSWRDSALRIHLYQLLHLATFISGVYLFGNSFVRLCRIHFSQNLGRALITWIFPNFLILYWISSVFRTPYEM